MKRSPTRKNMVKSFPPGGMAERFKATDLKSVVAQVTGGSNPSPSAGENFYKFGEVPERPIGLAC